MRCIFLLILCVALATTKRSIDCSSKPQSEYPFCDPKLDIDTRVDDFVSRLTLEECSSLLNSESPAIERLGVNAYDWRSNCLHGWGWWGRTTDWRDLRWQNFPMPVGLGATFNPRLIKSVGDVTAKEGRALHNMILEFYNGTTPEAGGLNCFSPNINLIRDPRWGRNMEVFSEDPYLTTIMGGVYTYSLQQKVDGYYVLAASPKHFAVHSGPDKTRLSFVANATEHDLYEFFLPQFETQVRCLNALEIMPAYSGLRSLESPNGEPDVANPFLLQTLVRKRWGRPEIHVMSDNTAVLFAYSEMKYASSPAEAAELSLNAGTDMDLNQGDNVMDKYTVQNVKEGKVQESTVRDAVKRAMRLRMLVGDFDSPERVSLQKWGREMINTPEFKAINLQAAHEAIVMLRNDRQLLPLKGNYKRIAVIGNNADNTLVFTGDYEGLADHTFTLLEGIQLLSSAEVVYAQGCADVYCNSTALFAEAIEAARGADLVILALGTDKTVASEREDMLQTTCEGVTIGSTQLPGCQGRLVEEVMHVNEQTVLIGMSGQQLNNPSIAHTVLFAPFLGNFGGVALADVLYGNFNVGGRLPFTLYANTEDLPPLEDYDMTSFPGRTYRYHQKKPEYPFGYGLSYSTYRYSNLKVSKQHIGTCESITLSVEVTNEGPYKGNEAVQVYVSFRNAGRQLPKKLTPIRTLQGLDRVYLENGETKEVQFQLDPINFSLIDENGKRMIFEGSYEITVGGGQKGYAEVLTQDIEIEGPTVPISTCTDVTYYCPDFSKYWSVC